jgi:hypothetical protein
LFGLGRCASPLPVFAAGALGLFAPGPPRGFFGGAERLCGFGVVAVRVHAALDEGLDGGEGA